MPEANAGSTTSPGLILRGAGARLCAEAGEIILLCGEVGSGKTLWLERMAGLQEPPPGIAIVRQPQDNTVVRMHFDRNPPLWLGQNVLEELCFGLAKTPSSGAIEATLHAWRIAHLPLDADLMHLDRLQGIRLSLAAMDLAGTTLALLDNPTDALPKPAADTLIGDIAHWVERSGCIVAVACNRWQDWRSKASQIWRIVSPMQIPKLDSGER